MSFEDGRKLPAGVLSEERCWFSIVVAEMKGEVGEAAKPVYQTSNTIFEIHKRNSNIKRK